MEITHELMLAMGFREDGVNKGCYRLPIPLSIYPSDSCYIRINEVLTLQDVFNVAMTRTSSAAHEKGQEDKCSEIKSILGINEQ